MIQALEKLDKSMSNLCLELMKYSENDPRYKKALSSLAQQYLACKTLMALEKDDINNVYFFKYADMDGIETLLTNAGYLEQAARANKR